METKEMTFRDTIILAMSEEPLYDRLVAAGLENTYYITTDQITTPDGEWSSDSIHYTDYGYRQYCEALLAVLRGIVK